MILALLIMPWAPITAKLDFILELSVDENIKLR